MDIPLLVNLFLIILFFFLRTKEIYTALYSLTLFLFVGTCFYLFYRYGMRESANVMTGIYFYSAPILLAVSIYLIYKQYKSSQGIGIKTFLSAQQKESLDNVLPAIVFFVSITGLCYLIADSYESNLPHASDNIPTRYSIMVTHVVWQYLYIIPLSILFWFMGLKKAALVVLICSVAYPVILIGYLWFSNL